MQRVTPFIWFDTQAEAAMRFYTDTFPDGKIIQLERYSGGQGIPGEDKLRGKVLTGVFEIAGQRLTCLDGGPVFKPGGNISLMMEFESQTELDSVWEKLLDGGTPQQCGWITDKFGTTWQIVPAVLGRLLSDPTTTAAQKQALVRAMMPMVKLDGPALEAACRAAT